MVAGDVVELVSVETDADDSFEIFLLQANKTTAKTKQFKRFIELKLRLKCSIQNFKPALNSIGV